MKDSSVAERFCLKCYRTIDRNNIFQAVRNLDVELQRRLGLGVTEFMLLVYRGPVQGMRFPRESRKRKNTVSMNWISKQRFDCGVLLLTSSVDLASHFS